MNKIIEEFRKRYPEYDDWTDTEIWQNLKNPEKFKLAFPEYEDWDNESILKNLAKFETPVEISPSENLEEKIIRTVPPEDLPKTLPKKWGIGFEIPKATIINAPKPPDINLPIPKTNEEKEAINSLIKKGVSVTPEKIKTEIELMKQKKSPVVQIPAGIGHGLLKGLTGMPDIVLEKGIPLYKEGKPSTKLGKTTENITELAGFITSPLWKLGIGEKGIELIGKIKFVKDTQNLLQKYVPKLAPHITRMIKSGISGASISGVFTTTHSLINKALDKEYKWDNVLKNIGFSIPAGFIMGVATGEIINGINQAKGWFAKYKAEKPIRDAMKVLGVSKNDDLDTIRKKYVDLIKIYHPDMPTGNPEKAREIIQAYELLRKYKANEISKDLTKIYPFTPAKPEEGKIIPYQSKGIQIEKLSQIKPEKVFPKEEVKSILSKSKPLLTSGKSEIPSELSIKESPTETPKVKSLAEIIERAKEEKLPPVLQNLSDEELKQLAIPEFRREEVPLPKGVREEVKKYSLIKAVQENRGIKPESVKLIGDWKNIPQGLKLQILRKGGLSIDEMAEELQSKGILSVPPDRRADDYLLEQLIEEYNNPPSYTETIEVPEQRNIAIRPITYDFDNALNYLNRQLKETKDKISKEKIKEAIFKIEDAKNKYIEEYKKINEPVLKKLKEADNFIVNYLLGEHGLREPKSEIEKEMTEKVFKDKVDLYKQIKFPSKPDLNQIIKDINSVNNIREREFEKKLENLIETSKKTEKNFVYYNKDEEKLFENVIPQKMSIDENMPPDVRKAIKFYNENIFDKRFKNVYNSRHLNDMLNQILFKFQNNPKTPISVGMIDIENLHGLNGYFKRIEAKADAEVQKWLDIFIKTFNEYKISPLIIRNGDKADEFVFVIAASQEKTKKILEKIEKRIDDAVKEAHLNKIEGRDKEINGKTYKVIGTGFTMVADSLSPEDTVETLDERLSKKLSNYKDVRENKKILTEGGDKNVNEASFRQIGIQERGRNEGGFGQGSRDTKNDEGKGENGEIMAGKGGLRETTSETSGGRDSSNGISMVSEGPRLMGMDIGPGKGDTYKQMAGMEKKSEGTGGTGISKSGEQGKEGEQVSGAGLPPSQPPPPSTPSGESFDFSDFELFKDIAQELGPQRKKKLIDNLIKRAKSKFFSNETKEKLLQINPTYFTQKVKSYVDFANIIINNFQHQDIVNLIKEVPETEFPPKLKIATAIKYVEKLDKSQEYEKILDIVNYLDEYGRELGRGIVLFRYLIPKLSPVAKGKVINNVLDRINKRFNISFSEEFIKEVKTRFLETLKITNPEERELEVKRILDSIAEKIPLRFKERITLFRYANMLSNPRSHLRNFWSNLVQTFITLPVDNLATSIVELIRHPFKSEKREVNLSDIPLYYIKAITAMPKAIQAFVNTFKEKATLSTKTFDLSQNSMLDYINSVRYKKFGGKYPNLVLNAMEGADRFFRTLIQTGEEARLLRKGVEPDEAYKKALELSDLYLFRKPLGNTENEGYFIRAMDSIGKIALESRNIRKYPVLSTFSRLFVAFVTTPINISKEGLRHTLIGAVGKKEWTPFDIGALIVGTLLSYYGYQKALKDEITFLPPRTQKEKKLYYESGRKPFSIKIGKWIPVYYFGALAIPLLLPAIVHYYIKNAEADEGVIEKILKIGLGINRIITEQTPTQNISDLFSVLEGDVDYSLSKIAGSITTQYIPASGFWRYLNIVLDPVYRRSKKLKEEIIKNLPPVSIESDKGKLKVKIEPLTKRLMPYLTPENKPAIRDWTAKFLPYAIGTPKNRWEQIYKNLLRRNQIKKLRNKLKNELKERLKIEYYNKLIPGMEEENE